MAEKPTLEGIVEDLRKQALEALVREDRPITEPWLEAREIDRDEYWEFVTTEVAQVLEEVSSGEAPPRPISYAIRFALQVGYELAAARYIGTPEGFDAGD